MKCDHCAHARPHKAGFKVCKHPRTLDFQRRLNGSETGLHVELCWNNFCRERGMFEASGTRNRSSGKMLTVHA